MEIAVSPTLFLIGSFSEFVTDNINSEEEDPDDYPFPLTLRSPKKATPMGSPNPGMLNGVS